MNDHTKPGVYLFSIDEDSLKKLIKDAVVEAFKEYKPTPPVPLSKAEACRRLGVCYNTFQRMLQASNRTSISASELDDLRDQYDLWKYRGRI